MASAETTPQTDWDSERVGSVVYSIVDIDVTTGEGGQAWAICDRCGWLPLQVAYSVDGVEVQVIGSKCEPHVCPPLVVPVPATSAAWSAFWAERAAR